MKSILINEINYSQTEPSLSTDVSLQFKNFNVSLVNSIRRILLSEIPNIAFKKVTVINNTTLVHNEFIKHRINLIPIFREKNFKFHSFWNNDLQKREYKFEENAIVPIFKLKKEKNKNESYLQNKIEVIYSNDFKIYNNKEKLENNEYFKKDLFTGDYIKIMILKNENEILDLESKPEIGFAYEHSGYSPIGNVSYSYERESNVIIDKIKKQKFDQINIERKQKGLKEFEKNGKQHQQFNKSFNILDSDRIYKKNEIGECNIINMNIESIGVIEPLQAFIDSLYVLKLKIQDLVEYSFKDYKLINNSKFELKSNKKGEITILMFNENHTLGNLINDYLTKFKFNDEDIIEYNNYKLVHPLEDIIEFNIKLLENEYFNEFSIKETIQDKKHTYIFVQVLETILKDIESLIEKSIDTQKKNKKIKTIINSPSFKIENVIEGGSFQYSEFENSLNYDDAFF